MEGLDHDARAEMVLTLVRVLAPAATLDRKEAQAVADRALAALAREIDGLPDRSAVLARTEEIVRRAARRDDRRSVLVGLPADAAARLGKGDLDLETVFGDLEPEVAGFMLLEVANRLPARYRIPLLLSHVLGWSAARIASLTGAAVDEVETTLTGALRLFEREARFAVSEVA